MLGLEPFFQIILAAFLGALIGLEREYKRKEAGIRTFALVSLGACVFTIIALALPYLFNAPQAGLDLTRVIQAVAVGIGFLGAGLIMRRQSHIEGLTTAAGLWATAGVGVAVGMGLYVFAWFVACVIIVVFYFLKILERKLNKVLDEHDQV